MKLTLAALFLTACVPAAEMPAPRGAAGFDVVPSSAARGEPWVTADGWTVTFSKVIVEAYVTVGPLVGDVDPLQSGSAVVWLFDGSKPAQIFVRKIAIGPYEVSVLFRNSNNYDSGNDDLVNLGVSDEEKARFALAADVCSTGFRRRRNRCNLPTVIIALRAEKAGRTVELDLSWAPPISAMAVQREIRADALALGPLSIEPERLLMSEDDQAHRFEPIAAADTNHDGRVMPDELFNLPAPPLSQLDAGNRVPETFADILRLRCGTILVP